MDGSTDISTLYREFTDALTEVLAKMPSVRHVVADSRELALPSRSTPTTASLDIF